MNNDSENVVSVCDRLREVAYSGRQEDKLELKRVFRRKKLSIFGKLGVTMTENSTNQTRETIVTQACRWMEMMWFWQNEANLF